MTMKILHQSMTYHPPNTSNTKENIKENLTMNDGSSNNNEKTEPQQQATTTTTKSETTKSGSASSAVSLGNLLDVLANADPVAIDGDGSTTTQTPHSFSHHSTTKDQRQFSSSSSDHRHHHGESSSDLFDPYSIQPIAYGSSSDPAGRASSSSVAADKQGQGQEEGQQQASASVNFAPEAFFGGNHDSSSSALSRSSKHHQHQQQEAQQQASMMGFSGSSRHDPLLLSAAVRPSRDPRYLHSHQQAQSPPSSQRRSVAFAEQTAFLSRHRSSSGPRYHQRGSSSSGAHLQHGGAHHHHHPNFDEARRTHARPHQAVRRGARVAPPQQQQQHQDHHRNVAAATQSYQEGFFGPSSATSSSMPHDSSSFCHDETLLGRGNSVGIWGQFSDATADVPDDAVLPPEPHSPVASSAEAHHQHHQHQMPQHPASAPTPASHKWELPYDEPLGGFPALPFDPAHQQHHQEQNLPYAPTMGGGDFCLNDDPFKSHVDPHMQQHHQHQMQLQNSKRRRSSSLGCHPSMVMPMRNVRPNLGHSQSAPYDFKAPPAAAHHDEQHESAGMGGSGTSGTGKMMDFENFIDLACSPVKKPLPPAAPVAEAGAPHHNCEKAADVVGSAEQPEVVQLDLLPGSSKSEEEEASRKVTASASSSKKATKKKVGSSSGSKSIINKSSSKSPSPVPSGASSTSSAKARDRARKDAKWRDMLSQLAEYKNENGDCVVPRGYVLNTKLASWVAEQRKQYRLKTCGKPSNITQERVDMLNELGFAWNAQEAAWSRHFEDLKRYRNERGDCMVPLSFTEYPQLGLWVKEQRRHYTLRKQGKHSHMTQERIEKLESVNFTWDSHDSIWWERFRELEQYREYFGDCLVPTKYSANPKLGTWVHHQRRQYRMLRDGQPSHMTKRRVEALEGIGFNWAPRADRNRMMINRGASTSFGCSEESSSSVVVAPSFISSSPAPPAAEGEIKNAKEEDDDGSVVSSCGEGTAEDCFSSEYNYARSESDSESELDVEASFDDEEEEVGGSSFGLEQAGTKARAA